MTRHNKTFLLWLGGLILLAGVLLWMRPQFKIAPAGTPDYKNHVFYYAERYNLDPALVFAVIKAESNFDPKAHSHRDAYGLMQITDSTLKWALLREGKDADYTTEDLYDPKINIKYGCLILSLFSEEFQDRDTVLAAYNAGRGNVLKWLRDRRFSEDGICIKDTPFQETDDYIQKVQKYHQQYKEMLQP